MNDVAVITLHRGRKRHLQRLLEGLDRGEKPRECIVVEMGDDAEPLPHVGYPLRRIWLTREGLPLAAARNAGRAATNSAHLIFLDVDCIPSTGLIAGFADILAETDAFVCCPVRYLPPGAVGDAWSEAKLAVAGRLHHARSFPHTGLRPEPNPGLFWSLAFAIRTATFDRVGGFDEGFSGYGAEDTDFAFRAVAGETPLLFAGGFEAFHQHHPVYDPPLQHFADIVRNARLFRTRHGIWPMIGWLDAFARLGLVALERDADITVLRAPSSDEIEAARLSAARLF